MKLISLRIKNFCSIKDSDDIRIEPLQAFVGENNAGKSNILTALDVFLTPGVVGVTEDDYYNPSEAISITGTFGELLEHERKPPLRKYLLGDKLILEKQIVLTPDKKNPSKLRPEAEYHGYLAKPKDWWLSVEDVIEKEGPRPKWKEIAEKHSLTSYVTDDKGGVTKASYAVGINKYLEEHSEIEFVDPILGKTQALGFESVLLNALPAFHLLPAITDYTDEIDKRSTNTSFRKLMADLSERLLQTDPRYQEITATIGKLTKLLNPPKAGEIRDEKEARLTILSSIEDKIRDLITKMMPTVEKVRLDVTIDEIKEVFSRGVAVLVNDGKEEEVVRKGHGMQRCIVFAFLQALIMNQRGLLVPHEKKEKEPQTNTTTKTIILGIEEPELYIHPQLQRLIYWVLNDVAQVDQVLYTTHEPTFVDIAAYHQLAVVRKESVAIGTKITQCDKGVLGSVEERKGFQFLNSFGVERNEMFFARKVILVEGEDDFIGIIATGRHLKLFRDHPEEIGRSIVVTDNKEETPKFMRILNAFKIPYTVLHELDGNPNSPANQNIKNLLNGNCIVEIAGTLEEEAGHAGHFHKAYDAKMFFKDQTKISQKFKDLVAQLFAN